MSSSPGTDRVRLTTEAYADSRPLEARRRIYDYICEPFDIVAWTCAQVDIATGARVLEVGCGPGPYLAHLLASVDDLQPYGCDLSLGMAIEARAAIRRSTLAVGDAQSLPFRDRAFDVTFAPHMLYHVPDIGRAAAELARVTRGNVVIVTNARGHTEEMFQLLVESAGDVIGREFVLPRRTFDRFLFEDSVALLDGSLAIEHTDVFAGTVDVPTMEPVIEYVDSMRSLYGPSLPDERWSELLDAARVRITHEIGERGVWTMHTGVGVLVCAPA